MGQTKCSIWRNFPTTLGRTIPLLADSNRKRTACPGLGAGLCTANRLIGRAYPRLQRREGNDGGNRARSSASGRRPSRSAPGTPGGRRLPLSRVDPCFPLGRGGEASGDSSQAFNGLRSETIDDQSGMSGSLCGAAPVLIARSANALASRNNCSPISRSLQLLANSIHSSIW